MGEVIRLTEQRAPAAIRMQCSACGATADAACGCGAHYVPVAQRAAEKIKADPSKSDRAIAKELGCNQSTVSRVRQTTTDASASVGPRIGLDGKTRRLPLRSEPKAIVQEQPIDMVEYAKDHFRELVKALKKSMSKEEWKQLVKWLETQKWHRMT